MLFLFTSKTKNDGKFKYIFFFINFQPCSKIKTTNSNLKQNYNVQAKIFVLDDHRKYLIIEEEMSHSDCRKACRLHGGDLLYLTYEKFVGVHSKRFT